VDKNKLIGHIPDKVFSEIDLVAEKFAINTNLRLAHFLGQCSHESGGFKHTVENLNYSVKSLMTVFPKYFKQPGLVESYARKPEMIASRVYSNRMGNGSEGSRDGWKFRGRGYIQLTGKNNVSEFDKYVPENLLETPDLIATKYPLLSAGWFFYKSSLLPICDKGINESVIKELTKRINGGFNGLDDRIKYTNKFGKILGLL
jgi:putative chitinase